MSPCEHRELLEWRGEFVHGLLGMTEEEAEPASPA